MRAAVVCGLLACAGAAQGQIVFQANSDNGFFAPFSAGNAGTVKYGDSGWLSAFGTETYTLTSITLALAVFNSTAAGTTDIVLTINDGDPSGLVFGPGTVLYTTTVEDVVLPDASKTAGLAYFSITIPLPGIQTTGGFNNSGWSVSLANFDCNGQFGFQCSRSTGQAVGFYTNNASFWNGSAWSLFSFGPDPVTGVANFATIIEGEITAICYPNCDGSTGTPLLTANDFQCFLNKFAANDTYANCDDSTGTPLLTANDFQCFLNKYAGGCS